MKNAAYKGTTVFKERVEKFLELLPISIRGKMREEAIKFALQVQEGFGSTILRKLAFDHDCLEDFTYFKAQFLDSSYYIHRILWVEVVNYLKGAEIKDETTLHDIEYCIEHLPQRSIEKLRQAKVNNNLNVDSIDFAKFKTGKVTKRDLYAYAKSKANTLNFLADYDPGFGKEDFVQDILCEAVRVFNSYPRSKGKNLEDGVVAPLETRVQKYIETALNNKVMNIKEFNTCESRRRVASTCDSLYKKKSKLEKLIGKDIDCEVYRQLDINRFQLSFLKPKLMSDLEQIVSEIKTFENDYYSTVSPLVKSEDGEERVIEVSADDGYSPESLAFEQEDSVWLDGICKKVSPNVARFVKIVVGEKDEEFEKWAAMHKINTDSFHLLVNGARKYLNITQSELQKNKHIREALLNK